MPREDMPGHRSIEAPTPWPMTANHWLRGAKAYGRPHECVVVQVWWPIDDPKPTRELWS